MAGASNRPLSPHLQIWKWGPHMLSSILHRVSGFILASAGMLTLLWWVIAISYGPEAYETFRTWVILDESGDILPIISNIFFRLVGVAVSWAFFFHLFSGLRHLVLDTGAGYELKANRNWSILVVLASFAATIILWAFVFFGLLGG